MTEFELLSRIIRKRRAIYPEMFTNQIIDNALVNEILENANWAPTHRRTEPWRFHVFQGDSRKKLSEYMAQHYQTNTPEADFSESKFAKTKNKALLSSHIIAICMKRDPKESLPEWEEKAAVACAVMNMWLSCSALGIGCYWSTPASALEAQDFLGLGEGEICMGWFYMGYPEQNLDLRASRGAIDLKTTWHY